MSCKPFQDKLEAYALGLLSGREKALVQQHVQTCGHCRRSLAVHQKAAGLLAQAFDQNPPEYLRSKVMANLRDVKRPKTHWVYWTAPGLIGVAALVLIIKIQPDRINLQPTTETAKLEQENAVPAPSAPEPVRRKEVKTAGAAKPARKAVVPKANADRIRAATALPLEKKAADDFGVREEPQALAGGAAARSGAEMEEQPMRQEYPAEHDLPGPAGGARPASASGIEPEKRRVYDAATQASPAWHPEQAAPLMPAGKANEAVMDNALGNSERAAPAPTAASPENFPHMVSLLAIQGKLKRAQVLAELQKLNPVVADRIKQDGDARTVQLSIAVGQDGRIASATFVSQAFKSSQLNQYILDNLRTLHFDPPLDSLPATIIIAIQVQ